MDYLELRYKDSINIVKKHHQDFHILYLSPCQQAVSLLNDTEVSSHGKLQGSVFDIDETIDMLIEENQHTLLCVTAQAQAILAFILKEQDLALRFTKLTEEHKEGGAGMHFLAAHSMFYALTLIEEIRGDNKKSENYQSIIDDNLQQLKKWAYHSKENSLQKYLLVQAEIEDLSGNGIEALSLYEQAANAANKHKFIHEEALAYELAAYSLIRRDMNQFASLYLQKAYALYERWGAKRKLKCLRKEFPIFTTSTKITEALKRKESTYSDIDLETIIRASQKISSEIELDKLLSSIIQLVIENTGATKGYLVIKIQDQWYTTKSGDEGTQSNLQDLDSTDDSSLPAINYVIRTKNSLDLNDIEQESEIWKSLQYADTDIKSLLCFPLILQNELKGVIYLENNISENMFTDDRKALLEIIGTQAAIALENALVYQDLDSLVKKRTKELNTQKKFMETLLDSQEQLIITTDGEKLRTTNETFLDFFAVDNIEEFMEVYNAGCICDTFNTNAPKGYLQIHMGEDERESWIEYVISRSFNTTHKAMITIGDTDFIFSVSAAKLPGDEGLKSAVFTNITEMENAKKELIESKEQLEIAYEAGNLGLWDWRPESGELFTNDIWETMLGYEPNTFENTTDKWANLVHPDDKDGAFTALQDHVDGKTDLYHFIHRLKAKDGSWKWINDIGKVASRNIDGTVSKFIGVHIDITEITEAKQEVERIHKHTRESIEYASLIQSALIPNSRLFRNYFKDYFAIWHPKDTVGGDIYLFEELRDEDECLLMVIDCTGHGVPGAFVTMLVKAIERQVIAKINSDHNIDVSPAWILAYFNRQMKTLLNQNNKDSISNAGFDGGIIYYNKKDNVLKFAGAETPLFYMEGDELKTIKGNRHSIGYKSSDSDYEFKDHIIETKEGMNFYLTTDGYLDQNGGEKSYPMGKKKFTKLIVENQNKTFADQQELLLLFLGSYQSNEERNDDITVVGFKI